MQTPQALDQLPPGTRARVATVQAPADRGEWAGQLQDLGFLPGEIVSVLRRAQPGGDPLVVRVGESTYALRRAEAACVNVTAEGPAAHG